MTSIASSFGVGSGVDTAALTTGLVDAQFAAKKAALTKRSETVTTQISELSQVRSAISGFSTALTALAGSGTLATGMTSADANVVAATRLPGATISGVSGSVEVFALAAAQVTHSATALPAGTAIGTGSIRISIGGGAQGEPIAIGPEDATLSGIASKINAAKQGVTASVVRDSAGERLVLKGATGAASAFSIAVDDDPESTATTPLSSFATGGTGMNTATVAADARFSVDGVALTSTTNSVTGVLAGVRLDLRGVSAGPIAIGTQPPTEALTQAVNDFVTTFNEVFKILDTATDPKTGSLRSDPAVTELKRQLKGLTLTPLLTGTEAGAPSTLAEIGIRTNRDGTLSVDAKQLASMSGKFPTELEAMFAQSTGATGRGLPAALGAISLGMANTRVGIGASAIRYAEVQSDLAREQGKVDDQVETVKTRMTRDFAAMDARVAAYKSTMTFLENQIKAWNSQD